MVASHTFHLLSTAQGWVVLSAIVVVVTGTLALLARGRAGLKWLGRQAERRIVRRVPRDTMRVVPSHDLHWFDGTVNGRPATQLGGRWLVTNPMRDSKTNLVVARIELQLPLWKRLRLDQQASQTFQAFPEEIPWGATRAIHAAFWLVPRLTQGGKDLQAHVVFIDQFENRKRVKARFRSQRRIQPVELPREQLSAIEDSVEKSVASVLQAELADYQRHNRSVGGLGSVTYSYDGQVVHNNTDWGRLSGVAHQMIADDPQKAVIHSENADALLALFERLDDDDHGTFFDALLSRVRRDTAYAPIAYLALLVLLELGEARRFFPAARQNLLGDDVYGFSNSLMLLDRFLQLRHADVDERLLDEIENFIEGTNESPFFIPQRIAGIRADRLRRGL
jgi:hypothetical protein